MNLAAEKRVISEWMMRYLTDWSAFAATTIFLLFLCIVPNGVSKILLLATPEATPSRLRAAAAAVIERPPVLYWSLVIMFYPIQICRLRMIGARRGVAEALQKVSAENFHSRVWNAASPPRFKMLFFFGSLLLILLPFVMGAPPDAYPVDINTELLLVLALNYLLVNMLLAFVALMLYYIENRELGRAGH